MIGCLDVHYGINDACAALVLFEDWQSHVVVDTVIHIGMDPPEYEPGQFYKRELPYLLEVLSKASHLPDVLIVDGYVWLEDKPSGPVAGLGAHLFDHYHGKIPVVGVAKTPYKGASPVEVYRSGSTNALYITAAGLDPAACADRVKLMHGKNRIPTMLQLADRTARTRVLP